MPAGNQKLRERLFAGRAFAPCYYCGRRITRATATLEHMQPKARGGRTTRDNCRLACFECNHNRGTSDPIEFRRKMRAISAGRPQASEQPGGIVGKPSGVTVPSSGLDGDTGVSAASPGRVDTARPAVSSSEGPAR